MVLGTSVFCLFLAASCTATDFCEGASESQIIYLPAPGELPRVSNFFHTRLKQFSAEHGSLSDSVTRHDIEEIYFDTPDFQLYRDGHAVSISTDRSRPEYEEARRKVRLSAAESETDFRTRQYRRRISALERHPLTGIVRRRELGALLSLLSAWGISESKRLLPVLRVEHAMLSHSLDVYGQTWAGMSLDRIRVTTHGLYREFVVLRFSRGAGEYPVLTSAEQQALERAWRQMVCGFQIDFPHAGAGQPMGYRQYQAIADRLLPWQRFFTRYPLLFRLGQAVILSGIAFLVLYLVIGRHRLRPVTRVCVCRVVARNE